MIPKILHLYGPLYINSYGVCIAIGVVLIMWLWQNNPKRKILLSDDQAFLLVMYCIGAALLGGRTLFLLTSWNQLEYPLSQYPLQAFELWNGGGSVLGCILGVLAMIPWFCRKYKIPTLALLDFMAPYGPLLQSISRIGCFLAGCCYGKPTSYFFGITYYHPDVVAPRFVSLHPTQLYSAILLFLIFLFLRYMEKYLDKTGQLIALYLMLSSMERFFVDFLRGDQQFFAQFTSPLTINQWIALIIFCGASIAFYRTLTPKTHESF